MTDEELRATYRRAIEARGRAAGARVACPSPEAISALVRREGPEAERLRVLDHVMSCAHCGREFQLLRSIEAARAKEVPAVRPLAWRHPVAWALAATVLFAVVLGPGRSIWDSGRSGVVRGASEGVALVGPAEDTTLPAAPVTFVWRPVDGATSYALEVLTADGVVRHAESTRDTSLAVEEIAAMPSGDYRWWVRARVPGGEQQSALRAISVRER